MVVLIVIGGAMYPLGTAVAKYVPPQNPEEIASLPIGETVLNGTSVVDTNKIRKVPVIYHPEYVIEYAKNMKYWEIYTSLTTGAVPLPMDNITGSGISESGAAEGIKGPGMLTVENKKLIVTNPTFVWGFKTPNTIAVKTANGIDIKQDNITIKSVNVADFNNDTIPHSYMSLDDFKTWYNKVEVGNSTALDYSLNNFNDGRNKVPAEKITNYFGEGTLKDMQTHPADQPIMAYNGATSQKVVSDTWTVMNYYATTSDAERAYNANQFIKAWNNTVIPPHTSAHGSTDVFFLAVYDSDPNATVKWASHGTCPPGRALRDAVMGAGSPLPTGMTMDYTDTISNYANLVTDITVENTNDYPIKIIMWSDGGFNGAGMSTIYAQVLQLT
jgi:hypothetical protein